MSTFVIGYIRDDLAGLFPCASDRPMGGGAATTKKGRSIAPNELLKTKGQRKKDVKNEGTSQ